MLTVASISLLVLCALAVFVLHGHDESSLVQEGLHAAQLHDPHALLAEADRLAFLGNWTKARPLSAEAERIYGQRGDERDALYAGIGRLRADVERTPYTAGARYISEQLKNPLVEHDARLKLECLTVKGVIDMNTNTAAARLVGTFGVR